MAADLRELKTHKEREKESMMNYVDTLKKRIDEGSIANLIIIVDDDETVRAEAFGELNMLQTVGMFDVAKLAYQLSAVEPLE